MLVVVVFSALSLRPRKHDINRQFEGVVYHAGKQITQKFGRLFKARVSIYLDEPRFQILVYHKIVTKYLEAVFSLVLVHLLGHWLESHSYNIGYLSAHDGSKIDAETVLFEDLLRTREAHLVSLFKFTVVLVILLHGIICQMYEGLVYEALVHGELLGGSSDVAVPENVASAVNWEEYP